MTWVDWAIIIVLAGSVIGGLMQGFFRTACSLIGLLFGLSLAERFYGHIAAVLLPLLRVQVAAEAIGFFLIALLVMAVFHFLGVILSKAFKWIGLGCLDTLGGAVVGFIQGLVLVMLALVVTVAFFPQSQWLADSQLPRQFFGALNMSTTITPAELAEKLRKGLRLLEQESQPLMPPPKKAM